MQALKRKWAVIVGFGALFLLLGVPFSNSEVRAQPQTRIADLPAGAVVTDTRGFTEPWIVLSHDHFGADRTLLVLKGVHPGGNRPYYSSYASGSSKWENSDIRTWLRGDFYNGLSERFRTALRETTTKTYGQTLADETVFLLSAAEWGYTDTYDMYRDHGTQVAGAGSYRALNLNYWTRSPSYDNSPSLFMIKPNGVIQYSYYSGQAYGVRPSVNLAGDTPVYGPYGTGGNQFYTLFSADPAAVLARIQSYASGGNAGELTVEELEVLDARSVYAVNLAAYRAAIEGAGTIASAAQVQTIVADVNGAQQAVWLAVIGAYAAAGDAEALTIEELKAAGAANVEAEQLLRYRAAVAGAGTIADAAALQALIDEANGQALRELFARIQQYAVSGNAEALTIEELTKVGAAKTEAANLNVYKAAIVEAGTIADLAELQRTIDRSNALTKIRGYAKTGNARPLTVAELEDAGAVGAVASNLKAYGWAIVRAGEVGSPGELQQMIDRANEEQSRAARLIPEPISALPPGTVVKETKGFAKPWIVMAHGHFGADLTLLTLNGVHPIGNRSYYDSFDYDSSEWGNSHIRTWLRNDFYNGLSERFRTAVEPTTTLTYGKTLTDETAFLLSAAEWGYTSTYNMYRNHGTVVAGAESFRTIDADYWTRSPGYDNSPSLFYVKKDGTISIRHYEFTAMGVRPSVNIGSAGEVYGPYYDENGEEFYTLFAAEPAVALALVADYAVRGDADELTLPVLVAAGIEEAVAACLEGYKEAIARSGGIADLAALQQLVDAVNAERSSVKTIDGFRFDGLTPPAIGIIDEAAKTIEASVPYGTDISALAPTIAYNGAALTPASGEARDFSGPVTYTVTATDGSEQSYTATVTVRPVDSADAPVLLTAEADNGQVSLSWSPAIGATDYKIYWRAGTDSYLAPAVTVSGAVYGYTATGLANGTTYRFAVRASYAGVDSELSNELAAVPRTVPDAPTGVVATAGDGQAEVRFEAPGSDGGSPIVRYEVADATGRIVAAGAGSPIVVQGLTNGTAYAFSVRAVNSAGTGLSSALSNEVIPIAPTGGGGSPGTGGGESGGNGGDEGSGGNGGSGDNGGGAPSAEPKPSADATENAGSDVKVWVNGLSTSPGTVVKEQRGGRPVTVYIADSVKLERVLASAEGAGVRIQVADRGSNRLIVELDEPSLQILKKKQATFEVEIGQAVYILPIDAIDLNGIIRQADGGTEPGNLLIQIEVSLPSAADVKKLETAAAEGRFELLASPVEFAVRVVSGGAAHQVSKFNFYVERLIEIPEGGDENALTTGIAMDEDGSVRHVPTKQIDAGGKRYAKISSVTNSLYAIVSHSVKFSDTAGHWGEAEMNEMGSRMVVNGSGGLFSPDRQVTRAEFAAMLVRGLGLRPEEGTEPFSDIKETSWYAGAVNTAHAYGIIGGFEDGTFRPHERMTREQAMVMIARAMSLTGLKAAQTDGADASVAFTDAEEVSGYARSGVAAAIRAGVVTGKSGGRLEPKAFVTRAEVAAIVKRLLEKSNLI